MIRNLLHWLHSLRNPTHNIPRPWLQDAGLDAHLERTIPLEFRPDALDDLQAWDLEMAEWRNR